MTSSDTDERIVARRRFTLERGGTLDAELLEPQRVSEDPEEWVCRFRVSAGGAQPTASGKTHGIDSLQALTLALESLRRAVEAVDDPYQWDGSHIANDSGIPRCVPPVYDYELRKALGEMIDREVAAHEEREASRRNKKK